ncbi:MAG: hypothetical protein JO212_17235 [Acetobacteraceae bacterium]|nr:hypothetical protein [Acetobacteraceae bacterium]
MTDRNQIILAISREIGARIDRDDPLVVAALLNDRMLDESLRKIEAMVKEQADRIVAAGQDCVEKMEEARNAGCDIARQSELALRSSMEWIETRMREAGDRVAHSVLSQLREEAEKADRASKIAPWSACIAGFIAVCEIATWWPQCWLNLMASDCPVRRGT